VKLKAAWRSEVLVSYHINAWYYNLKDHDSSLDKITSRNQSHNEICWEMK